MPRNDQPDIGCQCGKQATYVCSTSIFDSSAWFCDEYAAEHECEEDMLQPVVNSPHMVGMCTITQLLPPPGQEEAKKKG